MAPGEFTLTSHFQVGDQHGQGWRIFERAHFVTSFADGASQPVLAGKEFSMADSTRVRQIATDAFENWDGSLQLRRLGPASVPCESGMAPIERDLGEPAGNPSPPDPIAGLRTAAEAAGLIRPGDPIDQNQIDFAYKIVERCACAAEAYCHLDDSAADAIRAVLGDR